MMKKRIASCIMGIMLLSMSIGILGCGKENKVPEEGNDSSVAAEAEEGNDSNVAAEAEEGSAPVELVYWNQWTQEDEIAFLEKYIEEYNNSQDKYHVSFLAIPFEEYTTTKLATAFATNEAPDIFECSRQLLTSILMPACANRWMILLRMT